MSDWGELYREHVAAVGALATGLSDEQVATAVPACPGWTVQEVLAHLAGGASDVVTGRMDGAPAAEWTSRHVNERASLPLRDLVEELGSLQDAVAEAIGDAPFPGSTFDIAVHHADLHEALGLGRMPERLWLPVVTAVSARAGRLADAVAPYELFRAVFSRRSRGQMAAWGTDLTAEELDGVGIFGPRDDDQPVPA